MTWNYQFDLLQSNQVSYSVLVDDSWMPDTATDK